MVQVNYDKRNPTEQTADILLPGSKSMAARQLILDYVRGAGADAVAGIAGGEAEEVLPENFPLCDDSRYLANALKELRLNPAGKFYLGSGATSLRFFVALVASLPGFDGEIDVSPQLRRRPLAPLVEALRGMGAEIKYLKTEGYPPLYIKGKQLEGGKVSINGAVSSQFVSALMLASPLWKNPVDIETVGGQVSVSYVDLTRRMIERGTESRIEADWSAATFFYEIALLCPGREVRISGLTPPSESLQGDSGVAGLFNLLGVETVWEGNGTAVVKGDEGIISAMRKLPEPLELDMGNMPDAVPALAVGMSLAGIKFRFTNIAHLRHKESNRIEALRTELEKIGIFAEAGDDFLAWTGRRMPMAENEVVESRDDHRIAMAFAPAAAVLGYVAVRDPQCVDKSFPGYFEEIGKLGFEVVSGGAKYGRGKA